MARALDIVDGKLTWAKPAKRHARGHQRPPKPGEMNKTEQAYEQHLRLLKAAGEIQEYWPHAVTLKIGPDCRYTPDFLVWLADGRLALDDSKGAKKADPDKDSYRKDIPYVTEDARVKIRAAAQQFPFVFRIAYQPRGKGWIVEEI